MDAEQVQEREAADLAHGRPDRLGGSGGAAWRWAPALGHGRYRVYLAGSVFAEGATYMFQLTAAWMVYELATPPLNAAFMLGVLGFCRTIPMMALVLVGGVAADWVGRRRMLVIANAAAATVAGTFAALTLAGSINVWLLLLAALLMGSAMAFQRPSHQAFIRDLVTGAEVQNAVALMGLMQNLLRIGAPLLAGGLLAGGNGGVALALIAAAYATMAGLLGLINVPRTVAAHTNVLSSLAEVFRYIRADRLVSALMLVETIPGLFALPFVTLMPIFAGSVYGRGAEGLGVMQAMTGIGALAGAATLTMLSGPRRRGPLLLGAIFSFGVALVVFALVTAWPLALVLLAVIGLSDALYIFTINGLLLHRAPDHLRGRVMSVFTLADIGISPVGSIMVGSVAGVVGAQAALAITGSITAASAAGVAGRFRRLREV